MQLSFRLDTTWREPSGVGRKKKVCRWRLFGPGTPTACLRSWRGPRQQIQAASNCQSTHARSPTSDHHLQELTRLSFFLTSMWNPATCDPAATTVRRRWRFVRFPPYGQTLAWAVTVHHSVARRAEGVTQTHLWSRLRTMS